MGLPCWPGVEEVGLLGSHKVEGAQEFSVNSYMLCMGNPFIPSRHIRLSIHDDPSTHQRTSYLHDQQLDNQLISIDQVAIRRKKIPIQHWL